MSRYLTSRSVTSVTVAVAAIVVLLTASVAVSALAGTPRVASASPSATDAAAPVVSDGTERPDAVTCSFAGRAGSGDGDRNVSVTTWVAPASAHDELRNASAVADAVDAGRVTSLDPEDPTVATTDLAVHRIELNGSATDLLDRLTAQDRGSPTANFRALVQGEGVAFRYSGPSACPPRLALNETVERGALWVVPDRANESLWVVADVDELVYYALRSDTEFAPDDRWDWGHHGVSLALRRSSGLVGANVTAESHYEAEDPRATFLARSEGLVRLSAGGNRTVRGRTTVAPGTEIRVQLRPVEAPTDRLNATTTVNRTGGFAAAFDLSGVDDGALYTVRVAGMERDEDFRRTTLVAVGNATGAAVHAGTPESEGLSLDDVSAATTHGGFAVVRNASGGVVGVSEYLDPGAASPKPDLRPPVRTNQTVTVALYRDANGNRTFDPDDEPYRANGSVVRDTANVTIEGEPPEVPTTATPVTTTTLVTTTTVTPTTTDGRTTAGATSATERPAGTEATPNEGATTAKTTTAETTGTTVPGFGPAVGAIAVLLALAAFGRRR